MYISVKSILHSPKLQNAEILAGRGGLSRAVKRASVADLLLTSEEDNANIFNEGDLFLTCLAQFYRKDEKVVEAYFDTLLHHKSSGLLIVPNNNMDLITERIRRKCDEADYPLLYLMDDIPYADILSIINDYIAVETLNQTRTNYLQKIMYESLSEYETIGIINRFNSNLSRHIQVACFKGEILSDITYANFHVDSLNTSNSIYVRDGDLNYYIVSSKQEDACVANTNRNIKQLYDNFDICVMGASMIYEQRDMKRALLEAKSALKMAVCLGKKELIFSPLSTFHLLLELENSHAAASFYDAFIKAVRRCTTEEYEADMMRTVWEYVKNKGNYKLAAKQVNQHENTVRYRINKLKSELGLEDDNIAFHEALAIAVKLGALYHSPLEEKGGTLF